MLFFCKRSTARQLLILLLLGGSAVALSELLGIKAQLRPSLAAVLRGAAAGLFISIALVLLALGLIAFKRIRLRDALSGLRSEIGKLSPYAVCGSAAVAAGGEEALLRGIAFPLALRYSVPGAFFLNFILSGIGYLRLRDGLWVFLLKGVEGSFYALLYQHHRSLLMVMVAHAVCELLLVLAVRSGISTSPILSRFVPGRLNGRPLPKSTV